MPRIKEVEAGIETMVFFWDFMMYRMLLPELFNASEANFS